MSPELEARAAAHGLVRGRSWWGRARYPAALVFAPDNSLTWYFQPERSHTSRDRRAFATEAEALTAALDWLDAGEPREVETWVPADARVCVPGAGAGRQGDLLDRRERPRVVDVVGGVRRAPGEGRV